MPAQNRSQLDTPPAPQCFVVSGQVRRVLPGHKLLLVYGSRGPSPVTGRNAVILTLSLELQDYPIKEGQYLDITGYIGSKQPYPAQPDVVIGELVITRLQRAPCPVTVLAARPVRRASRA